LEVAVGNTNVGPNPNLITHRTTNSAQNSAQELGNAVTASRKHSKGGVLPIQVDSKNFSRRGETRD